MIAVCMLFAVGMVMTPTASAGNETNPDTYPLYAGQDNEVGYVEVWNNETHVCVKFVITAEDWVLTETHLAYGDDICDIPQTPGRVNNPIPGQFPLGDGYPVEDGVKSDQFCIPLDEFEEECIIIAVHAVVALVDDRCYDTGVVYGIERFSGDLYEIDVLAGTSSLVFEMPVPPGANSASPNGLAYDSENGYLYYTDYQLGTTPDTLYFWNGSAQQVAGQIAQGKVACADFHEGKYYYIPSTTDDLREISFNPDGTILTDVLVANISGNVHGWTFDGDIAIKDGIVYGWGHCGVSGHGYEFFTYDLGTSAFWLVKPAYQQSLQLAFGSDGVLYGHRSATGGYFYAVDTTDASVTLVEPTPDPPNQYTDTASGEICKPFVVCDETAWAAQDEPGTNPFPNAKNWATYVVYCIQDEIEEEWPEGGTVTVAFEDGTPDWDYNDWVVDIETEATFWGSNVDNRVLTNMNFTIVPEARGAGYNHVFHMLIPADTFGCDGTYNLTLYDGNGDILNTIVDVFDASVDNDFIAIPDTKTALPGTLTNTIEPAGIVSHYPNIGNVDPDAPQHQPYVPPQRTATLGIDFGDGCPFDFGAYDPYSSFHGEGLFFDPYLHVVNTNTDIHAGNYMMLTVPMDWMWPEAGVGIWLAYPDVTAGGPPTFGSGWWNNYNDLVYDGKP